MTLGPSRDPRRHTDEPGGFTATLEEVDRRSALSTRPARPPDPERLSRALAALVTELAENPRNMLHKLVETGVDLCRAGTAGISVLDADGLRWEAVAGVLASCQGRTMPRAASPCGACIDEDETQLMYLPHRRFPAWRTEPRCTETLLVPFRVDGRPAGTMWIVSHAEERIFDREDERIVRTLARFASAGWQLGEALEAAHGANRGRSELLATLGQELRAPVAAIRSATQILPEADATRLAGAAAMLGRQCDHLGRLADDLLDASRIGQGTLELRIGQVELQAVVAAAVETAQARIEHRSQILSVELPSSPVWITGDAVRLVQVLSSLLDNAAKYTPRGGRIWVTARSVNGGVEIDVRDTGIGIPPDKRRTVFDLFTQLEPSAGGLGIGLALVRDLVERHGGSVEATSEGPHKGSQFTVRLPDARAVRRISRGPRVGTEETPHARRLLIVEDHADVADSLALILQRDAHEVRVARDGRAALQALTEFRPDVVLLDVDLPDMPGYQVARRMREEGPGSNLTIIVLSGHGEEDQARSREAGCDAHLVKPVPLDVLRGMLGPRPATMSSV